MHQAKPTACEDIFLSPAAVRSGTSSTLSSCSKLIKGFVGHHMAERQ